jgi:hypothetical protein
MPNVMPWREVVAIHQKQQEMMLKTIDLYQTIADQPDTSAEDRTKLLSHIVICKERYLGLAHA